MTHIWTTSLAVLTSIILAGCVVSQVDLDKEETQNMHIENEAPAVKVVSLKSNKSVDRLEITVRTGSIPTVTEGIPHIQQNQESSNLVYEKLVEKVFQQPGIVQEESSTTFAGAPGLIISDEFSVNPKGVITGREFGHIHVNPGRGSLHLVLSVADAEILKEKNWGVDHPFATSGRIPGMVMVFAPRDEAEVDVVIDIIKASFKHSTT